MNNIYENSDKNSIKGTEITKILEKGKYFRIEKIMSNCSSSEKGFWYDQKEDEFVMIIEGEARLNIEGRINIMKKGDYIFIKKHTKHRVEATTENCLWLCIFLK